MGRIVLVKSPADRRRTETKIEACLMTKVSCLHCPLAVVTCCSPGSEIDDSDCAYPTLLLTAHGDKGCGSRDSEEDAQ